MTDLYSIITLPMAVTVSDISGAAGSSVWELALEAGPVVKMVLVVLLFMSVFCWGIIFFKYFILRSAIRESETFLTLFWESSKLSQIYQESKKLKHSPLSEMFMSGYMELRKLAVSKSQQQKTSEKKINPDSLPALMTSTETIQRSLEQASVSETTRLEKNLIFLATTGNSAPYIGLFGTVWGIMDAFHQIGLTGSASLATIGAGISEALIATALGLFAAIPAVIGYNYFLGKIKLISSEMDNFSSEFLNILERHFEALKEQASEE